MSRIINGVDLSALKEDTPKLIHPDIVKGRTVHIDADFLAYMVAADDYKSLEDMKHNANEKIEKIRLMAGAERYVLHLTPKKSDKGQRGNIAMLKEYQSNRNKVKPKFLHVIRDWMAAEHPSEMHMTCEADDGMSMAAYAAQLAGTPELCVIASKDKDLWQVPGLQVDMDTGELSNTTDPFGEIWLDDSKSQKKIRGRGWKYFWAQMLTGDPADTISGIPLICDMKYLPKGKTKACGPVMAYDILSPIKTNKAAFHVVGGLFKAYEDYHKAAEMPGFVNYRTGAPITWKEAFTSEAKLLFMRRNNTPDDVLYWLKETTQ